MTVFAAPPSRPTIDQDTPLTATLDLRLLLPAVVGWAVCATTLGWSVLALFVAGGVACAVAGVCALVLVAPSRAAAARRWGASVVMALAVSGALLVASGGQQAVRSAGTLTGLAEQRAVVELVGRVGADPRVLGPDSERRETLVVVRVDVGRVVGRGAATQVSAPVLVMASVSWREFQWMDTIRFRGRLTAAEPGSDVVALVKPLGEVTVESRAPPWAQVAEAVRGGTRQAVDPLPADARGLVPGLVIGDTSLTPRALTDDMRTTGLTHLCAVSGANVAIVVHAALLLAWGLRLPRTARPWLAGLVLAAFVLLARPEPSVLRAAVMGVVGLFGLSSSRRGTGAPALGAAIVVLLCWDPWLSRSYGFALSTLATLGLLIFAGPWGEAIAQRLPWWLGWLGPLVALPIAAATLCTPIIVLLQGQISLVGVLANLLAAPLVAPTTVIGVLVAATSVPLPSVAGGLAWIAGVPAVGIAEIAHRCAGVPLATIGWPSGPAGAILLALLSLVAIVIAPRLARLAATHPLPVLALLLIGLAWLWPLPNPAWPMEGWRFAACDVGQGDALVVRTGSGQAVVVDAGPDPQPVARCLDRLGITDVPALVLTHFHADHVGGLDGVLAGRRIARIVTTPIREPPEIAAAIESRASAAGVPLDHVQAGDVLRYGDVEFVVRWPARRIDSGSVPNNAGIVLDVRTPELRLALLADIERESAAFVRRELTQVDGPQDSRPFDVLKVAHHGSANQDDALMETIAAPVSVISVGADNDYGHPAPSLLNELGRITTSVSRTDRDGTVVVGKSDGRLLVAHERG